MSINNAVELENVVVKRNGIQLLSNISLDIATGSKTVVLGPNGAGKTTLFNILGALLRPSSGTVHILGNEVRKVDLRSLRKNIGMGGSSAIQSLESSMTAHEAILSGVNQVTSASWLNTTSIHNDQADYLLELVGLSHARAQAINELSMGERQQIGIARALISNPKILLLDEPTAGLDLGARERFIDRLERHIDSHPAMTTILVTHHLEEIPSSFSDFIALGAGGKLLAAGSLKDQLTSELVTKLYGYPLKLRVIDKRYLAMSDPDRLSAQ